MTREDIDEVHTGFVEFFPSYWAFSNDTWNVIKKDIKAKYYYRSWPLSDEWRKVKLLAYKNG